MHLGLDLGTSSLKAAIFDGDGELRWASEASYDLAVSGDRVEIDPHRWWQGCRAAMADAPADLVSQVRAVAISGQMHGLVLTDQGGEPIRPAMLWPDRRATAEVEVFAEIEAARPGTLANPLVPGMPGPMLLWLQRHEPDVIGATRHVLSPKDWVRSRLTADTSPVTDASDASATLLYDVRSDDWSADVVARLGLDASVLPTPVASHARAGSVTVEAGAALGVPVGVPVAAGAGDSAAALLGLGVESPGTVVLNVGTAGQAIAVVGDLRHDLPRDRYAQYRTAAAEPTWYAMAPILNAGLALNWVRTVLDLKWETLFQEADRALVRSAEDPVFVPYLVGERDPSIGLSARGAWMDLAVSHDAAALARSSLVGVGAYLARRARTLLEQSGADRVILSGGSMRNLGWAQLLTTLIGHEVDVAVDARASARGAAILAARSHGEQLPPLMAGHHLEPESPELQELGNRCRDRLRTLELLVATGQNYE